jgi:hypothetical protein
MLGSQPDPSQHAGDAVLDLAGIGGPVQPQRRFQGLRTVWRGLSDE